MSKQPPHTRAGGIFTEIVLEVFRLNGALLAAGDRMAAPFDLSSARWQVMGALGARAMTVPQIARAMGLTRQGVQRTVDILHREGVVVLRDNPDHKRAKLVALTDDGLGRLAGISARQADWANKIGGELSEVDMETARTVLATVRERLEQDE